MLVTSHFKIKDNDYLIKNNTYKPVFNVLKGNLLGAFAILYSNKMAKQMFLLRKKNVVFFDKNLYRIFKKNYATSAICYPNLIISDVSTTNLNHSFNIFKDGYYFKCYNTLPCLVSNVKTDINNPSINMNNIQGISGNGCGYTVLNNTLCSLTCNTGFYGIGFIRCNN